MLQKIKNQWKELVENEVKAFAQEKGSDINVDIQVLTPPKPEMGDVAFPMFAFSKALKCAPALIAAEIKNRLEKRDNLPSGELLVAGP
ncbi:MAG: arginine--tRNA ligase, partial [Bullifex sp.]|nr:arginine--tRNA ligase [Bullifex sp.]